MELKPISELADIITGFPFDGARYSPEGIRVVRGENVTIGALRWDSKKCWKDKFEQVEYYSLKAGDVVIGMDGSRVGHNRARVEASDLPLLLAQRVACLRAKSGVDPAYLYYLFKSNRFPQYVERIQTGSTVPHISKGQIEEFMVPCPDHKTQKGIGNILSALDAKITLNQRINTELEAISKLVYDYWFVQFDFPMSAAQAKRLGKPKLEGKPYKSSGGHMVYNAELKREVPEGWAVTELRKYIGSNRGHSYASADIGAEGRPMINLNSFNTNSTYKGEGLKLYSGELNLSKVLEPFDLVMCNTQQTALDPAKDIIGKSLLVPDIFDEEIVSSHHVTTIRVNKTNLKYYLNTLFGTDYFHRHISGYCTGTNILGLNFEGVLSFQTAIPNDGLLERFASFILSIEQRKSVSLKENQELTALRDWLLPLLMNGQVRVAEAEQKVGLAMAAEPIATYGKSAPKKLSMEDRAALNGWVIHTASRNLVTRTKAEKIEHMIESVVGFDHQRDAVRDAAGPIDIKSRIATEAKMTELGYGRVEPEETQRGRTMQKYHRGKRIQEAVAHTEMLFGEHLAQVRRIVDLMRPRTIHECEVYATLYAAWNDLLHFGKPTSDNNIIYEASYNWHERKAEIAHEDWTNGLKWLRDNDLVPTGRAKPVRAKGK